MSVKRLLSAGSRLLGVIALGFLVYVFLNYREKWGITDAAMTFLFVMLLFFYMNYVTSDLRERIGLDNRPSQKWIDTLLFGKPIKPNHEKSEGIPEKGWGVSEEDHAFFEDFAEFADFLNEWLSKENEPWRLQERAGTRWPEAYDSPSYGKIYSIFYNQQEIGSLALQAGLQYSHDKPNVFSIVKIIEARLIPYRRITSLHSALRHHLTDEPHAETQRVLLSELMETVWEIGSYQNSDLKMRLSGLATTYLKRRGHAVFRNGSS